MDNATLDRRAKELERDLQPTLRCYTKVGWMKQGKTAIFIVYFDRRVRLPKGVLPRNWYGLPVRSQAILPPGVRPPDADDEGIAF